MSLVLTAKSGGDFIPHPEGIHSAVCVDVMDLGMQEVEFQGRREMKPQLRICFESELVGQNGVRCMVDKKFTQSLHPKSRLAQFIGAWRGRPVIENESIDLAKLVGSCCTLVISQKQNVVGRTYAAIDAITKPTKKVTASGQYDPAAARQRFAEWSAKQSGGLAPVVSVPPRSAQPAAAAAVAPAGNVPPVGFRVPAKPAEPGPSMEFDPEVGF